MSDLKAPTYKDLQSPTSGPCCSLEVGPSQSDGFSEKRISFAQIIEAPPVGRTFTVRHFMFSQSGISKWR
jgi:hypothetical protein